MENDAAAALRALAASGTNRSKIGRVRELYQEIEDAKKAGVSQAKIVEALNAQGLDLTVDTLRTMLNRIRTEIQQGKTKVPAATVKTVPPAGLTPKKDEGDVRPPSPAQPKKPGEPERFDWEKHQADKPEW